MQNPPNPAAWSAYLVVRVLWFALGRLPDSVSKQIATLCFRLLDWLIPRYRRIAMRNLQLAFPDWSEHQRAECINRMYYYLAQHLWVLAKLSSNGCRNLSKYLRIQNLEVVQNALHGRRGLLFATGHLGAWELSAQAFGHLVQPMDVVARPLDNPYLDAWIERLRTQTGNRVLQKSGALREVLRALHANRAVGFLLDQNVISPDACFVDFFGIPTSASTAFAKIAHRSGAVVVPGFAIFSESEKRYVLRFYPPLILSGDAVKDTQAIQTVIEQVVREAPEQWLWIHRRFKTRPPGQPSLYP